MKADDILKFSKPVLVGAVRLSQRKQLVTASGSGWHDWVQSQPESKRLRLNAGGQEAIKDPHYYDSEDLADFLAALSGQKPDAADPNQPPVKPKQLLKRYLPWLESNLKLCTAAPAFFAATTTHGNTASSKAAGDIQQQHHLQHQQHQHQNQDEHHQQQQQQAQEQQALDPVWQLMQRTRRHPRFSFLYSFDSYEKGWVCTGRIDGEVAVMPTGPWKLLGIDCEMCETEHSDSELLQVSVVDDEQELVLQELVLPPCPVLDFRTFVTGITEADLQGVTLTRRAVAKRISKLLSPSTVLVGHSLYNDLRALRLDHPWVIDTSMIYEFKGGSHMTPSLALVSQQVLGYTMRKRDPSAPCSEQEQVPHDSREDASVALALVLDELQRESPHPPLEAPPIKVDPAELAKLCVHMLPEISDEDSLNAISGEVKATFAALCRKAGAHAEAAAVQSAIVEQAGRSKFMLLLVFTDAGVANDVFQALPGDVFNDNRSRQSKHQFLQDNNHKVTVRTMAPQSNLADGKEAPSDTGSCGRKRQAPTAGSDATDSSTELKRTK